MPEPIQRQVDDRGSVTALETRLGTLRAKVRRLLATRAGALIGLAGAVGALGGVAVNLAFRQSFLTYGTADAAYLAFIAFYVVCVVVTWVVYLRPTAAHRV